ncbi:MAG: LPXTG cell wall anchor domain-containing protein, partial [Oscillospiraceae bacterium]|nr:LPXTG cell wall anchor domain-containing protein [Oscillospiraceae bacterium]
KGKTTVYNVTAELVSDTLTAYDVEFLGNIAPGASAEASFDFTASQMGTATGKILITYEDASGTETTMEQSFTIEVIEEPVWNEPVYTEPAVEPEQNNMTTYIVLGVIAAAAAGGFVVYKKKKAKKLAELEDEDEDI